VIFGGDFSILKLFLKLSCYHDNTSCLEFSKARVSACMYFLVVRELLSDYLMSYGGYAVSFKKNYNWHLA
jgi:hypothetical protein